MLLALEEAEKLLEKEQAQAAQEAALARARIAAAEHRLELIRDTVASLGLHPDRKFRSISGMGAAEKSEHRGKMGRPLKYDHPFSAELKRRGSSLTEWADKHDVKRHTVQSWVLPPPNQRSIPLECAKLIEAELGIPLSVWGDKIR